MSNQNYNLRAGTSALFNAKNRMHAHKNFNFHDEVISRYDIKATYNASFHGK